MAVTIRDSRALWLLTVLGIVGALYIAKAVFIPLALAVLLTFVLAPPACLLRQWGLSRVPAVLIVVLVAFISIAGLVLALGQQLNQLASELPKYEYTITQKIQNIRNAVANGGTLRSMSELLNHVNQEISPREGASASHPEQPQPTPVRVVEASPPPAEVVRRYIEPLLDPVTTSGLILVLVIFFLLERETLRDRVIRLAGSHDLRRTTQLIDDGARRLSRYFLAQTLVNALFGAVVAIGLTLIGVPNPVLWGILGMLLRFVPYLGAWIAGAFPIAISFAVDPGWSMTVWTAAFLLLVELVIGQAIEPFLYGRRTGVTPVAVIVSATFWTWLWGPIGLFLSMPLTVCLGVLGRHIEALEFLEIMIGDEPPLTLAQSFYHRALSGSENEAIDQIEEALKNGQDLITCYQDVVLEALVLAEVDRHRGVLDDDHADKMNKVVQSVLAELADQEDRLTGKEADSANQGGGVPIAALAPAADHQPVLVIAGPGQFDHTIALVLAQLLEAKLQPQLSVSPLHIARLDTTGVSIVYLSCLHLGHSPTLLRYSVRRLRRRIPSAKIVACLWGSEGKEIPKPDVLAAGADVCAVTFAEAISYGRKPIPVAEQISEPAPEENDKAKFMMPILPDDLVNLTAHLVPTHG
jgi:predicted PurR-regulated permease PerM